MRRIIPLFTVLVLSVAILARILPGARTVDDAFITFRYARNILDGHGFVYNPGERVLGTTTPLYTLLMVGLGSLTGGSRAAFPDLALGVNCLADALTCWLIIQIGKRLEAPWVGLVTSLLWAVAPFSVTFAIGGLETSVYVFCLTTVAWGFLACRYTLTGLAAAAAFLTRVDAVILLGPLAIFWLVQAVRKKERLPLNAVLCAVIPVALWLAFSAFYFGGIFSNSISAKLVAYRLSPGESLIRLLQHYALPFSENNLVGTALAVAVGLVLYPFLSVLGLRAVLKKEARLWFWGIYPFVYFAVFAIANPLLFRWYLTPPLPAWFFLIILGASQILGLMRRKPVFRAALASLLVIVIFTSSLLDWRFHPDHGPDRPAPDMAYIQLELLYQEAAEKIQSYLAEGGVLAAGDVGVLGFQTGAPILDLVGLNSPQVTAYYPLDPALYSINYAVAPQSILDAQPAAIVILEVYGREGLLKSEAFQSQYELVETIDTDMYGSRGMLLFRRRP